MKHLFIKKYNIITVWLLTLSIIVKAQEPKVCTSSISDYNTFNITTNTCESNLPAAYNVPHIITIQPQNNDDLKPLQEKMSQKFCCTAENDDKAIPLRKRVLLGLCCVADAGITTFSIVTSNPALCVSCYMGQVACFYCSSFICSPCVDDKSLCTPSPCVQTIIKKSCPQAVVAYCAKK